MKTEVFTAPIGTHGPGFRTEDGKFYLELWHNGVYLTTCPFDTYELAEAFIKLMWQSRPGVGFFLNN